MVMKHFVCALEGCNNEFDRNISPSTFGEKRFCCAEHRDLANRKVNKYILYNDYAEMVIESKTYGDIFVKIDLEDVERCKKHCWHAHYDKNIKDYYFLSRCRDNHKHIISLHRYIMNAPENLVVDHINHNPLDNRKSNLRICTMLQNNHNKKRQNDDIGVYKMKNGKYIVRLFYKGKILNLGTYENKEYAIKIRKEYKEGLKIYG
jgi:hypothetical protein